MSSHKKSSKSETDHLKERILKSGLPLQVEVASSLYQKFITLDEYSHVSTSAYYLDKDLDKGRELDIKAEVPITAITTIPFTPEDLHPMIFLNLLVQCKNIPGNAWVFFESPYPVSAGSYKSISVLDALEESGRRDSTFTLFENLHYRNIPWTTTYDEYVLDKNNSNKREDNLFEAIVSLAKATDYDIEALVDLYKKILEHLSKDDLQEHPLDEVQIFSPVVVFNGKMYMAKDVGKREDMTLIPTNHVGLILDYVSGSYEIDLSVEILHKNALERFLNMILEDIKVWRQALAGEQGSTFSKMVMNALEWQVKRFESRHA